MSEEIKKKASSHDINDKNTQWHMALPPTMKLELMEYKGIRLGEFSGAITS